MIRGSGLFKTLLAMCGPLVFEAGCTSHVAPAPLVQPSPLTGRFTTGVIVAVRTVDPTVDPALTSSIMTALGQTPATPAEAPAVEIVIQRSDRTGTSIVEPAQNGAFPYVTGEKIAIVEARATVVRPE